MTKTHAPSSSGLPATFDAAIEGVINHAIEEIGAIVRQRIVGEATRQLAAFASGATAAPSAPAAATAAAPAAAVVVPAPKRLGRPPGTKNAVKPAGAAPAPATKGKKVRADRSFSDADVARTIEVIQSKPGLLPSQYRQAANIDKKAWSRLTAKLKQDGLIKVTGGGYKTTYVLTAPRTAPAAAPAAAPAPTKAPAPAAKQPKKAAKASKPKKASKTRLSAITEAELRPLLTVIAKKPGLTSVQIQAEVGLDAKQAARLLKKLKKTNAVKVTGAKSKATYSVG